MPSLLFTRAPMGIKLAIAKIIFIDGALFEFAEISQLVINDFSSYCLSRPL